MIGEGRENCVFLKKRFLIWMKRDLDVKKKKILRYKEEISKDRTSCNLY